MGVNVLFLVPLSKPDAGAAATKEVKAGPPVDHLISSDAETGAVTIRGTPPPLLQAMLFTAPVGTDGLALTTRAGLTNGTGPLHPVATFFKAVTVIT